MSARHAHVAQHTEEMETRTSACSVCKTPLHRSTTLPASRASLAPHRTWWPDLGAAGAPP